MYERLKKGDAVWAKTLRAAGSVLEEAENNFYKVRVATVGIDGKPVISDVVLSKENLTDIPYDMVVGEESRERFYEDNFGPIFAGILHDAEAAVVAYGKKSDKLPDYRKEEMRAAARIFLHVFRSAVFDDPNAIKGFTDFVREHTDIDEEELLPDAPENTQ